MRLPIPIATLFLTATTALPAFAAAPAPIALRDAVATPIEAVQYQQYQQPTTRQRRQTRSYRSGYYRGYAAAPRARSGNTNPWGQCVGGLSRGASSAFPSWDTCSGR
jgi:hypothetical protein